MDELLEKRARQLVGQWDKLPQAGTSALESLLDGRLSELPTNDEKKQFLERVLELAQLVATDSDNGIKEGSLKRLESAVEGMRCRLPADENNS